MTKTAIIFTSKYGSTKRVAEEIAENCNNAFAFSTLSDIQNIESYDKIVLGIPVYAGSTNRDMRNFLKKNWEIIKPRLSGVFVLCWDEDNFLEFINKILPEKPDDKVILECLGGEIDPELLSEFEKKVILELTGISIKTSNIRNDKVVEFAKRIRDNLYS
jgi:menaquinone-dependent protoporphyrinogen oxidase